MNTFKFLTIAGLICTTLTSVSQSTKLSGNLIGLGDKEVNIGYFIGSESKTDIVKAKGDHFTWTAHSIKPQRITLNIEKRGIWLYLEPGNMELSGTLDSLGRAKLSGSKTQEQARVYDQLMVPISYQAKLLYEKYGKVSKEEQLVLEQQLLDLKKQRREVTNLYIAAYPESAHSLNLATDMAAAGSYKDILETYNKLGENNKATPDGKRLLERLAVLKRSDIGETMLNFTQNDMDGKPFSFDSFKGKYVLVDFWASWCGPCRAENPNVLKAYQTYKDKNFTVIGVSLDEKAEKWKKAIKDDGMPWTQVSDLKGWKNEVSQYYGVNGIPSTLLIDPNGKIIAKNLRGEILNRKLQDIFGH